MYNSSARQGTVNLDKGGHADVVPRSATSATDAPKSFPLPGQRELFLLYASKPSQIGVAAVIFVNFIISAAEAQVLPEEGTGLKDVFGAFEITFNVIFLVELIINMYANFLCAFWSNGWNVFDVFIVTVSWVSMLADFPGITVLRLLRAFRVFRLFKRIQALRMIITGVMKSLPGIANAFVILGLVMGIWSIMGVHFFGEDFPDEFGTFFAGMLTCVQMMTYDSWVSGITRPIVLHYANAYTPIFFISYAFISAIIMANVIIAILVDKYTETVQEMEAEESGAGAAVYEKEADIPMDPEMLSCITQTQARVTESIEAICASTTEIFAPQSNEEGAAGSDDHGPQLRAILPQQLVVKRTFDDPLTQVIMAGFIVVNFMFAAAEAQVKPLEGTPEGSFFEAVDLFFNILFTVELLLNMYGNFFFPFWVNLWNVFDFAIVAVSLFSMFGEAIDVTALRLFRAFRRSIVAFRVVRLLKMKWVKMIVLGVLKSLPGVINAFVLLGLVMGIWSIMGVNFFRDDFPDEFGSFFLAMLSMLQIMSFDSWSSGITRPVCQHENTQSIIAGIFFITYVFASAIIMANVVLAILIDKFLSTAKEIAEQEEAAKKSAQAAADDVNHAALGDDPNPVHTFGDRVNSELVELQKLIHGPLKELFDSTRAKASVRASGPAKAA